MPKALVLIGSTASGKSKLAMRLARKSRDDFSIPVEILAADSMQVYKGMDIGTAKPTSAEQAEVVHHGLDLAEPSQDFSVELYKKAALKVLERQESDCNILVVGGTGLYIRSLVDDLQIPPQYKEVRAELEAQPDTQGLWNQINELDPVAAATMEPTNRRRILRALEVTLGANKPFSSFGKGMKEYGETQFLQVGLRMPRDILDARIDARYEAQMEEGFLGEVQALAEKNPSKPARQALGYKELLQHLDGECALQEALTNARLRTKRFARRQERWFRRDHRIKWLDINSNDYEVGGNESTEKETYKDDKVFTDLLKLYQDYFGIN